MVAIALAATLVSQLALNDHGLLSYVGRDLTKLTANEIKEFESKLAAITRHSNNQSSWIQPSPRWIKEYGVGQSMWLIFSMQEAISIPGTGVVRVDGLSANWKPVFRAQFGTGYRLAPLRTRFIANSEIGLPLLAIQVRSQGPFVSVDDGPLKPLFHPEGGMWQYYTFNDQGAYLIRITAENELMGNSFRGGFPALGGPDVSDRPSSAWKADLNSADPARQLSAMVWLSSDHLNSRDWRREGFARESVGDSISYEVLRVDYKVKERLKQLKSSFSPWIREQASFTLGQIAKPLAPVEEPPDWN